MLFTLGRDKLCSLISGSQMDHNKKHGEKSIVCCFQLKIQPEESANNESKD